MERRSGSSTEHTSRTTPAPSQRRGRHPKGHRQFTNAKRQHRPLGHLAYFGLITLGAGLILLLIYARPYRQSIAVGGPDDRAATIGFLAREVSPTGTPYRWSTERSTLLFRAAGLAFPANQPVMLDLNLVASRPSGVAAPRLVVTVNGVAVGETTVSGQATGQYPLAQGLAQAIDTRVALTTDDLFTPPGDERRLGVAVYAPATLVQQSGSGIAIPPLGAWWRWLATILALWGVAVGALRHPRRAAVATGIALATLVLGATLDRGQFWELIHLPMLVAIATLPLVWRRDIADLAATALATAQRRWNLRPQALVLASLPLLIGAQALFSAKHLPIVALILGAIGILVALVALTAGTGTKAAAENQEGDRTPAPQDVRTTIADGTFPLPGGAKVEAALLLIILALAAFARFWQLDDIPFGLWRDEARHALTALHILADPTYRPVYEPEISLPGLYPLLLAGVFRLFGENIASLRGLTAGAGVAAVAALWLVARQLWGPRVALVAALFAAVGSWRVSIDRLAFDTAPTTLCTLGAFAAYLAGVAAVRNGRRGLPQFAAAGLLGGLAIYGYYPGRFALPVLAGATLVLILRERGTFLRRAWPGLTLVVAVAALILIPLGRYAIEQPDNFFQRTEQVFVLAERYTEGQTQLQAVERNVLRHVAMFNWEGDPNARHHAPRWPLLDAATAICFVLGFALALVGAVRLQFAALFTLGWLAALLAPSIVSVDAPSAVRAQDAAPAAYLLAAYGLVRLWQHLSAAEVPAWLRRTAPAVVAAALALAIGLNLWLYFLRLPGDSRVLGKFQYVGETRAGLAIAESRARNPSLVAYTPAPLPDEGAVEVLRFTSDNTQLRVLPSDPATLPQGALLVVVIRSEESDFDAQLEDTRRFAATAGLTEWEAEPVLGNGPPMYIVFGRNVR